MAIVHEQQISEQSPWRPRPTLLGTLLVHRYRLTQVIGQGATGAVFRADDVIAGRPVAVRILHPSLARDQALISRIRARIQRHAAIQQQHPEALVNLVDIIDIGATLEGEVFVVTDHVDGDHLGWMLARGGRLPWVRAKPLFIRLCQIVHGLHQHGVVVGTLQSRRCYAVRNRPKSEAIKIMASALHEHVAGQIGPHASAAALEAARYASPELACGEPLDPRADVYSLGVIAYELLTGRTPFVDSNAMRLASAHLASPPPPLRQVAPEAQLPGALEEIILKALAKAPADRHANMDALAAALTAIPEHEGLSPAPGMFGHAPAASPAEAPKPAAPPPAPPVVGMPKFPPAVVMRVTEPAAPPTPPAPAPVPPPPVTAPRRPPSVPMPAAVLPSLRLGQRPFTSESPMTPPAPVAAEKPVEAAAVPTDRAAETAAAETPAEQPVEAAAVPADRVAETAAPTAVPTPVEAAAEIPARPAREPTPVEAAAEIPARPIEAKAEEAKAEEAKPAEAKVEEAKPAEATAEEAKPAEAKTEEAKAVEAKPAEATAQEAKPAEAKAEEAKPEEAKGEEAKPAARLEVVKAPEEPAPSPVKEVAAVPLVAAAADKPLREPVSSVSSAVPALKPPTGPGVTKSPAVEDLRAAALRQSSTGAHASLSTISGVPSESIIAELPRRRAPWAVIVGVGAAIAAGTAIYMQTQDTGEAPGKRAALQQPAQPKTTTQPATPKTADPAPTTPSPEPIAKVAAPDPVPERATGVIGELPPNEPIPTAMDPVADPPEEPSEKPGKKSDKKGKKKTVRTREVEPEEEDVFDQLRKHMEAKKAAEAARQAGIGTPQPQPTPAPAPSGGGDDSAAKARDALDRARQAASQGNHTLAYNLAKQSNGLARSTEAIELMGVSACKTGNADNARSAANQLSGARRSAVVDACSKAGIVL